MPKAVKPRKRYFYSYATVMAELQISRRTLQRWIDDMNIEPQTFEDHLRVFLKLPDYERLQEYYAIMKTRNMDLITRYRHAIETENAHLLSRVRKKLHEFNGSK